MNNAHHGWIFNAPLIRVCFYVCVVLRVRVYSIARVYCTLTSRISLQEYLHYSHARIIVASTVFVVFVEKSPRLYHRIKNNEKKQTSGA